MSIASGLGWHKPHPHRSETMRIRPNIEILHRKNASGKRHKVKGYNSRTYASLSRKDNIPVIFCIDMQIRLKSLRQADRYGIPNPIQRRSHKPSAARCRWVCRHEERKAGTTHPGVCRACFRYVFRPIGRSLSEEPDAHTLPCILESSVDRVCAARLPLL